MSYTRTVPNRPYDHMYDSTFTTSTNTRAYRAQVRANPVNVSKEISGSARYKYFRRPVVPHMQTAPPEVVLARTQPAAEVQGDGGRVEEEEVPGATRSVEVQTLYRESEAQTDPYSPEYILQAGAPKPEVLLLQHKKFGNGLPVGLREVQIIENARQKRAFEDSLPPLTDEASYELRRRLMAKQEQLQFRRREEEIQELQDQRLKLLEAALVEKDKEAMYASEQRVEALRQRKIEQKDIAVAAIQRRRITMLRKLANQRKREEARIQKKSSKRDIISEYADYKSNAYAPKTRLGLLVDQQSSKYDSRVQDIQPLQAQDLSESIPASMLTSVVKVPKPLREVQKRAERLIDSRLEYVHSLMTKEQRAGAEVASKAAAASDSADAEGTGGDGDAVPTWLKKRSKVQRPATPSITPAPDNSEANAIVLLQRLLRGRAVQNMMFEGRNRRRELLKELRFEEAEQRMEEERARQQMEEEAARDLEGAVQSAKDKIVGEVVSSTLNMLANHKVNAAVESQADKLAAKAQRERNDREAEESGRRQAEEMLRQRHDEMYRQLMSVHHQTVDTFVDELLDGVTESTAAETALLQITGGLPAALQLDSGSGNAGGSEGADDSEVIRDLVSSMVLPQVEREMVRQQVAAEERKYVDAASDSVQRVVTDAQTGQAGAAGAGAAEAS
eukprot:INCI15140.1.p1 GENE.INCI15140.1~~INCI15140.1.p1  ORF type:complete len:674 (-),score=163.36 INCI15140.1:69-2090(-)